MLCGVVFFLFFIILQPYAKFKYMRSADDSAAMTPIQILRFPIFFFSFRKVYPAGFICVCVYIYLYQGSYRFRFFFFLIIISLYLFYDKRCYTTTRFGPNRYIHARRRRRRVLQECDFRFFRLIYMDTKSVFRPPPFFRTRLPLYIPTARRTTYRFQRRFWQTVLRRHGPSENARCGARQRKSEKANHQRGGKQIFQSVVF